MSSLSPSYGDFHRRVVRARQILRTCGAASFGVVMQCRGQFLVLGYGVDPGELLAQNDDD